MFWSSSRTRAAKQEAPGHDLTALKTKGFQHLRDFFSEDVKQDLLRRAGEILAARDAGTLSRNDQDAQGFNYAWYEPVLRNEGLIKVAQQLFGPDICGAGWRILIKDKHYRGGFFPHQDWPYNYGNTQKLSVFVPLTHINQDNGGLFFYEESHFYGPITRGAVDLKKFEPINAVCPELNIGDVVLCDYMTWHSSLEAVNNNDRIMLQLNYQPATDASSKNLIAGRMPHERILALREDASSLPMQEVNARTARLYYEGGNAERAERYARALFKDDPHHAAAALLLYDILSARGDAEAPLFLDRAKSAIAELEAMASQRSQAEKWAPFALGWSKKGAPSPERPNVLTTPGERWEYGAISDVLTLERPTTIRIRGAVLNGRTGFCLVHADTNEVLSEQLHLSAEMGESTVLLVYDGTPSRLGVRNWGDDGLKSEVEIRALDYADFG